MISSEIESDWNTFFLLLLFFFFCIIPISRKTNGQPLERTFVSLQICYATLATKLQLSYYIEKISRESCKYAVILKIGRENSYKRIISKERDEGSSSSILRK